MNNYFKYYYGKILELEKVRGKKYTEKKSGYTIYIEIEGKVDGKSSVLEGTLIKIAQFFIKSTKLFAVICFSSEKI